MKRQNKKNQYDVVVVGGGLAGICAAIAAARGGCKTALIQDRPVLGGNSSSEIKVPIGGAANHQAWARESGIIEEIFLEDRVKNHRHAGISNPEVSTTSIWDLVLYESVKKEPSLTSFLNTSARKVTMAGKDRIGEIICEQLGTEKTLNISGNIFIDSTGDGTVGYLAGVKFRIGREAKGEFNESLAPKKADKITMGNTLMFMARDTGRPVKFIPPVWAKDYSSEASLRLRHPGIRKKSDISGGYWWIELGGGELDTINGNEMLRDELLKHLLGLWDHMKNYGDHGAENYALEWIGMVPGKRESRRLIGDYILTENDIRKTSAFPDAVGYGGWMVDLHTVGGLLAKKQPPEPVCGGRLKALDRREIPLYSIPYRCLYSKNIKNLMFAGRDISVTHVALGSTRVMATCAILGQAVGEAASLCRKYHISPRDVYKNHIHELQQELLRKDCFIPGVSNKDDVDIAKNAVITASSTEPFFFNLAKEYDELDIPRGQLFPAASDRIDKIELPLKSELNKDTVLTLHLCTTQNIWNYNETAQELAIVRTNIHGKRKGWITFNINCEVIPESLYWIWLEPKKGISWRNSNSLPVGTVCLYKPLSRWHEVRGRLDSRIKSYVLRITPEQYPYGGENIISGVSRPEKWTNIWISNHREDLPQYIDLDFGKMKTFNTIQITFDTNLNRHSQTTPSLYRMPECVKDYNIYYWRENHWEKILEEKENYRRWKRHFFKQVTSNKIRIKITATNGERTVRIYEVRVYNIGG